MAPKLNEPCCNHCWHGTHRPCPDRVVCMVRGPLCHESEACRTLIRERAAGLLRQEKARPTVFVGTGTCGLGAGAGATLAAVRAHLAACDLKADIVEVGCLGLCAAEPILDLQMPGRMRVSFGPVPAEAVPDLLDEVWAGRIPADRLLGQHRQAAFHSWPEVRYLDEHPFFKPQVRRVLEFCGIIDPASLDDYAVRGGYQTFAMALRSRTPQELCDEVEASGLRGRGGGGFPTGRKWKLALAGGGGAPKYLICNADEGDPGAFMDRAVIEGDPHRLLEGMALAAYAIGAAKAYVYIRAEYPLAVRRLRQAIDQARTCGFLGTNILDSGFSLDIEIKEGAGAFVCGEETALIGSVEGRRGMPRPRPPYPAVRGLFDRPTIINNVETLASVPGIVARGGAWYAGIGTAGSKGTKVFALSGNVVRTGLVEVAMGTTLRQIVYDIGGGIPGGKALKAVQMGGPSGGCIPAQHLDVEVDYESLKSLGAMMGSGGLVVMDETNCMVDIAKFFMNFIQHESCGKCIPCREGTRRMLEILQGLTRGRRGETDLESLRRFQGAMELHRLAEVIRDTSLCGLGQSAPNPVLSTLRWFREEYEAHIYERRCPAGACKELIAYRIDAGRCKGCTLCAGKCPTGAIMGARRSPHYIVTEKCVACGECRKACKFDAVTVA
jgi:NADH:ubiquinone oxidoreductase subunit F (NADH-binding)/NAD-dependent dihydropyrimidine dehydrogenase PreA subunit